MASPTQWTWVWVDSQSFQWTGKPGVLQSIGSHRVGHDSATELKATAAKSLQSCPILCDPTRLHRPWDSPGKNTGVGCHFLLQCMKVKSESEVTQLCLTLSDPMDCIPPGSSVHGIFQARVLQWTNNPIKNRTIT